MTHHNFIKIAQNVYKHKLPVLIFFQIALLRICDQILNCFSCINWVYGQWASETSSIVLVCAKKKPWLFG